MSSTMKLVLLIAIITALKTEYLQASFPIEERSITFENGYPNQYVSGSIHYFRVHPSDWRDRLKKLHWAGLHAVQTYIEWSSHEPEPGVYDFSGGLNVTEFLQIAKDEGLSVILRPGPFICAERDMGGLPYWLLRLEPNVQLRTSDTRFMKYVKRWFNVLFPLIRPFMYENGGPVVMVQVENEYGISGYCDHVYLNELAAQMKHGLGNSTFLFATDNGNVNSLQCSKIPPVYATVDFGPETDATQEFEVERLFEEEGPLINSEFYTGWIDHWGEPHQTKSAELVCSSFDNILAMGASINFYVFHGGTSFGFGSGANQGPPYQACPTSYDYDAPVSEAGDPTTKYFYIKNVIQKYFPVPSGPPPTPTPKYQYGDVPVIPVSSVFHILPFLTYEQSTYPKTFEAMSVPNGLLVYQTILPTSISSPTTLDLYNTHDRGYVFVNQIYNGLVSREDNTFAVSISALPEQILTVAVESQGRISIGQLNDFKGLLSTPTINGHELENWKMTPLPLYNFTTLLAAIEKSKDVLCSHGNDGTISENDFSRMRFFEGNFSIPVEASHPRNTFLKTEMFTKGYAWINGFLLGRYWPVMGPQITLYVPHGILRQGNNTILLLELETTTQVQNLVISLVGTADIDGPTP